VRTLPLLSATFAAAVALIVVLTAVFGGLTVLKVKLMARFRRARGRTKVPSECEGATLTEMTESD